MLHKRWFVVAVLALIAAKSISGMPKQCFFIVTLAFSFFFVNSTSIFLKEIRKVVKVEGYIKLIK